MDIFLSYQFNKEDEDLVRQVERVVRSHGAEPVTGRRLGGGWVEALVERRVEEADAMVALCTPDPDAPGREGEWPASRWVMSELRMAVEKKKPCIALVVPGVDLRDPMWEKRETIPLDREAPLEALLSLSETLAEWDTLAVKVQVVSQDLRKLLEEKQNGRVEAEYSLRLEGKLTPWRPVELVPEDDGVFAYIRAANTRQGIHIRVKHNGRRWTSVVTSQWVRVVVNELKDGR